MATTLDPATRRGYGLGSVATGAFGTVPGLLLLPYLTDRLGVAAAIAGIVVFLPKAWDVVLNPVAGGISDRSTNPAGRRRPYLLRAGLALAVLFVLLFNGPTAPTFVAALWVVVAFLACATAYAFFQVPYVAMPAEMTDDYDERTRLMTWRVAILAFAILLSGGLSPAIRDALGPETGYRAVGIFVGVLIAAGAVGAWWGTRHAPERREVASTASLGEQLRIVSAAKDFRVLLLTFVIQALGLGAMLAGVDYMARVVIGDRAASTILFACFVAPALVVTPFWQRIGERVGKKTGYLASSTLLFVGMLLTYLLRGAPMVLIALAVAVVGVGYAGAQMFPMAMLPDCAAADAAATGENRIGVYTGVWTAGETLGLALGPGLYALILAVGGYVSSTTGDVEQSSGASQAISLGFGVVPAVLVLISFGPLLAYRLTDRYVAEAAAAAGLPEEDE